MRAQITLVVGGLLVLPAHAAEIDLNLQIPQLKVAEYHRPYVAIWVEKGDQTAVANLAVWYQQKATNEGAGTKWLPDLRQWWRRSGRDLKVPVDGVTGATRPVGKHSIKFDESHPELAKLPAGDYVLAIEAAREVGGRELLRIPFKWRGKSSGSAKGSSELGEITLSTTP
ncbi:DUF2271 domain-containing protein [Arenimonas sp.]|uniref:DUF2271 domain-containing protein n=1 Tax=Arenimonas sp. TaxID=1872635 RepID=UPI0039E2CA3F